MWVGARARSHARAPPPALPQRCALTVVPAPAQIDELKARNRALVARDDALVSSAANAQAHRPRLARERARRAPARRAGSSRRQARRAARLARAASGAGADMAMARVREAGGRRGKAAVSGNGVARAEGELEEQVGALEAFAKRVA